MNDKIFDKVLLVSDIDETLSHKRIIPKRNIEAIHSFIEMGGKFVIATGRNLSGAKQISDSLEISQPVICINGACIYDLQNDKIIENTVISPSYKEIVLEILERFPKVAMMFSDVKTTYMLRENNFTLAERSEIHSCLKKIDAYKEINLNEIPTNINKAVIWDYKEPIDELVEFLSEKKYDDLEFVQSDFCNVEIIPKGTSKGIAMLKLCEALGIDEKNTAAIGDYYNDETMLRFAAHSCAPNGAPEEIKDICKWVAGNCEDGAVADFIEYLKDFYSHSRK